MNSSAEVLKKLVDDLKKLDRIKSATEPRVLLIEDNQSDAVLIGERFRAIGFQVEVVQTGDEALRKLFPLTCDYHLILLDLKLPDIDGSAILQRIRKFDTEMPVVIVTGATDAPLLDRITRLGIFGLLDKNKVQF